MMIPTQAPRSLVPARNWHFQFIAEHMREDERAHWLAMSGANHYDADTAAMGCINSVGVRFALLDDGYTPVVAGGVSRLRGNTFEAWMIGTPAGWHERWRDITRAVRWVVREQFRAGADRIQIVTLESRSKACGWYERALRMHRESVLLRAGAHGENLVMYATFRESWL
jgi:hypothetical protein